MDQSAIQLNYFDSQPDLNWFIKKKKKKSIGSHKL